MAKLLPLPSLSSGEAKPLRLISGATEPRTARIGESYAFQLEGNPSTGYRWRLDAKTSENLKTVKVDDLGYHKVQARKPGKRLVGILEV